MRKYAMGLENDPQKRQKTAKFHKIRFWAQTEGPRGSSLKCKSDRREISCGILVLKLFVRSIWTVEGQKMSLFYSETRSFS